MQKFFRGLLIFLKCKLKVVEKSRWEDENLKVQIRKLCINSHLMSSRKSSRIMSIYEAYV